jgi:transcription termination/antitermination protein NusA
MDIRQELQQVALQRDIPVEDLERDLETALAVAYKKVYNTQADVRIRLDASVKSGMIVEKEVVGELLDPPSQIPLSTAQLTDTSVQIGDFLPREVDLLKFGRIAASTFKQVLTQKLREAEMRQVHDMFSDSVGDIVSGTVTRREDATVLLSVNNRIEVKLPKREQVGSEDYRMNDRMRVFVLKIEEGHRGGFEVVVSRTHPSLVRKLMELEVPEVAEGIVEIKNVAREPGQRSKISVLSRDERIDAVGACVGPRGSRIQALIDELRPEKIDVVPYSEDPKQYILNALSPAKVNTIKLDHEAKSAYVTVPDNQLSLAIGRGGQNVRLAARLTDWRIDIRSDAQAAAERGEAPAKD